MSKYYLTFSGEINGKFIVNDVKSLFKKTFKLSKQQLDIIFSGKDITLKKDLTQQQVLLFASKIDELGGISYIEAMDKTNPLPEGISSDRRLNQRRIKIYGRRRKTRSGLYERRKNFHRRAHH